MRGPDDGFGVSGEGPKGHRGLRRGFVNPLVVISLPLFGSISVEIPPSESREAFEEPALLCDGGGRSLTLKASERAPQARWEAAER